MKAANGPMRVLLVDDHPVFREGLKKVVDSHPRLRVVAEASSLDEGRQQINTCRPDVLITDLRLAQQSGRELIRYARDQHPELRVVVITVQNRSDDVLAAVQAGASAYLTKGASRAEMLEALDQVLKGRSFIQPEVAHHLADTPVSGKSPTKEAEMSPREREILELLVSEKSPKEIGLRLCLSVSTVKTHIQSLYRKLVLCQRSS